MTKGPKGEQPCISVQIVEWIRQNEWWINNGGNYVVWTFVVRDARLVHVKAEYSVIVGAERDEKDERGIYQRNSSSVSARTAR